MKKYLFIFACLFCSLSASAQFVQSHNNNDEDDTKVVTGNGLHTGFRAILEMGFQTKVGDYGENSPLLNVAMGCQIGSHFFVGGGFGGRYYMDSEVFAIPVFANFRYDILNYRVTPYVDLKAGYTPWDVNGAYASIALGCRIRLGDRFALSLSTGYEAQSAEIVYKGYRYYETSREMMGEYFGRFALEF